MADAHGQAVREAIARGTSTTGVMGTRGTSCFKSGEDVAPGEDCVAPARLLRKRLAGLRKRDGVEAYRGEVRCPDSRVAGPPLVVCPDGTWYRPVTPAALDRIVAEHLVGGRVVAGYAFAANPRRDPA